VAPFLPEPSAEPPGRTARMLVNKLTYGPTPGLVQQVAAMGTAAWIDQQLAPSSLPDAEGLLFQYTTLGADNAANGFTHQFGDQKCEEELTHAALLRAVHSERQLHEMMCAFWADHFNVFLDPRYYTWWKNQHVRTVVRNQPLGSFSEMLMASARSPAMLLYLDNFSSNAFAASGVNENYARELLELHTLGIVNGAQVYDEADVRGVAKIMTGWGFGTTNQQFLFTAGAHSRDAVSVLGGGWSRAARTNGAGQADGESLLRFLARHRSTARHLSWKLAKRFVSDDPSAALVEQLADVYQANDTAIGPVLRAIFDHAEFASSTHRKVRRPAEQLIAVLRATAASVDTSSSNESADAIRLELARLDHRMYGRVSPDGYPDGASHWVSTDALVRRWSLAGGICGNTFTDPTTGHGIGVDTVDLLPSPLPPTVEALLIDLADRVAGYTLTPAGAASMCRGLQCGPSDPPAAVCSDPARRAQTLGLVLSHPSFQRR